VLLVVDGLDEEAGVAAGHGRVGVPLLDPHPLRLQPLAPDELERGEAEGGRLVVALGPEPDGLDEREVLDAADGLARLAADGDADEVPRPARGDDLALEEEAR